MSPIARIARTVIPIDKKKRNIMDALPKVMFNARVIGMSAAEVSEIDARYDKVYPHQLLQAATM